MEMLESIEVVTSPSPTWSLIWMHGLGADGHDFEPAVAALGLPKLPGIRFLFPHAPMRPITINMGMRMRAWYDILSLEPGSSIREEEAGVRHSAGLIENLIQREQERGIEAGKILLAGFSQGAAMALHVGIRRELPLGGILALSGYLALAKQTAMEVQGYALGNRSTPIFMAHGIYDPVVPFQAGKLSCQELERLGFKVDFRQYPCDHTVTMPEFADIGLWLRARIDQ